MSPLEIFAVLISLIGVGLTVIRNMWCWLFNFFAFVLYAYLFYEFKLYGETILQFFFMVVNFMAFTIGSKESSKIMTFELSLLQFKQLSFK